MVYMRFSLHMCFFPYKYSKILEVLLKLMKLCFNGGEQVQEPYDTNTLPYDPIKWWGAGTRAGPMILTPCPYDPIK